MIYRMLKVTDAAALQESCSSREKMRFFKPDVQVLAAVGSMKTSYASCAYLKILNFKMRRCSSCLCTMPWPFAPLLGGQVQAVPGRQTQLDCAIPARFRSETDTPRATPRLVISGCSQRISLSLWRLQKSHCLTDGPISITSIRSEIACLGFSFP